MLSDAHTVEKEKGTQNEPVMEMNVRRQTGVFDWNLLSSSTGGARGGIAQMVRYLLYGNNILCQTLSVSI